MRSPFIRSATGGFTLIEMMLAIALGLAVVYVAFAGFRVAAQAVTITNRMATENALMRAGCDMAHDRLDYWTDFDDPVPGGETQRLRSSSGVEGMPFTPMSLTIPLVPNSLQPERATGWDPAELWKASDPRTWWHGNVAEKYQTNMTLGRYGIFANTRSNLAVTSAAPVGVYGTVEVPHSWQYNQLWDLFRALGYYGFADYAQANTIFACYREYADGAPMFPTNLDGMPVVLFKPYSQFDNGEGEQEYPKGLWRLTMSSSYSMISPTSMAPMTPAAHQRLYKTGYTSNWDDSGFRDFNDQTPNRRDLFTGQAATATPASAGKPEYWPGVTVTTQRFIKTARFVNLCRVRMVSPITGEQSELAFTCFTTTLRGARLQRRHPDKMSGWADWDNASPPAKPNDPTLDDKP